MRRIKIQATPRAALALLVLVALAAAPAAATDYPPVRVDLDVDPDLLPVPGQIYRFTLEIEAAVAIDLVTADLQSDRDAQGIRHWEIVQFDPPVEVPLLPGVPWRLDCEVLCNDATQPLFIAYRVGAFSDRATFYLLPDVAAVAVPVPGTDKGAPPVIESSLARPDAVPASEMAPKDDPRYRREETGPAVDPETDDGPAVPPGAKSIFRTAHGRITYMRPDGIQPGCDGATVHLYDENSGPDTYLGSAVTDVEGYYSIGFPWLWAGDPDLYIVIEAGNGKAMVAFPGPGSPTYKWATGTKWNASGDSVNLGWHQPLALVHRAVLHQLSQLTRAWRMLDQMGYGFIGPVILRMPDSDWPHYKSAYFSIHLPNSPDDWSWADGTVWHEYGHHIVYQLAEGGGTDYCNAGDRCDVPGQPCRHCIWCEETAADAWNEGFPNYIADVMTRVINTEYNVQFGTGQPTVARDYETNGVCSVDNNGFDTYDDPSRTEGIFAALLRDLDDGGAPDIDPIGNGAGQDIASYGRAAVIGVALAANPTTPWAYLNAFIAAHPGDLGVIWSTAYNNGYNIDQTPPGIATNLGSPSHSTSGQSPDATIEFTWTAAPDNAAGIGGYSAWIGPAPSMPDQTADVGAVTALETGILPPGTYWFSIRAVDKAGNWSSLFATYGPLTIREPHPADLTPQAGPSFAHALVPRNAPLTFHGIAPEPASLNRNPVYLNLSVRNVGEEATVGAFAQLSWIDGVNAGYGAVPSSVSVGPLQYHYHMNLGPFSVPGGRHTLSMRADGTENLAEWSELNNFHAGQWIFAPHPVGAGTAFVGPAPVRPYAGWAGTAPPFQAVNCTGLRLDATGAEVSAMVVMPLATRDDYDLRSHALSLGALSGFHNVGSYAYSMRDSGCIDAVLVAPAAAFADLWDVGVINSNPLSRAAAEADFTARKVDSANLPLGVPGAVAWAGNEALALFHHTFPGRTPQSRVIEVIADPAAGPLHIGLYAEDTDHAALSDHLIAVQTDAAGKGVLYCTLDFGTWPITVWRDPRDAPGGLPLVPTSFTIEVREALPDLQPAWLPNWYAPLVPRPASDGTPTTVAAPASLAGDAAETWLNATFRNPSPQAAGPVTSSQYLDGSAIASQPWAGVLAGGTVFWNSPTPIHVGAGRHTLAMRLDPADQVAEESEDNNTWARQWSWRPAPLTPGLPVLRPVPPAATGGWADLADPAAVFYNVDGLRQPPPAPAGMDGHWLALAAMPGPASDIDLRLHEAADDAETGFAGPLAASIFGTGQSDYLLANFRATAHRAFDAGVVGIAGAEGYTAEVVASDFLAAQPVGDYGPFVLGAGHTLALHEVELPAGPLTLLLSEAGGGVDWGLTLHRANLPLQAKSTPMAGGTAWTEGPGHTEVIVVDVPEAGYYCVAVWKAFAADLGLDGTYTLDFSSGSSTVPTPGIRPERTALAGAAPNPFNPRTVLQFDLARDGHVDLRLFDLRGRAVRTLVAGARGAGRYEVAWDGTDDHGRPVTSGVYFARLVAGGTSSHRKLLLLK